MLFNLSFNTLMMTIRQEKYMHLGYLWNTSAKCTYRKTWMQFADDAIIISNNNKNMQSLLNVFQAWCTWSGVVMRLDKSSCFGMRKQDQQYSQYSPSLFIDSKEIPVTGKNQDFTYLGKKFNSNMNSDSVKLELKEKLKGFLKQITSLNVSPYLRVKILKDFIYPKISFELKMYNLGSTWIASELDSLVTGYLRVWFELPISTCVSETFRLPTNKCGLGLVFGRAGYNSTCFSKS